MNFNKKMYLVYCHIIVIPSYYTDAQKHVFLTICYVAGICGMLCLIYETITKTLAYGIFKDILKEFKADKLT